MFLHRTKEWWDCAIARAERTVAQNLVSAIPVGAVVTPVMITEANISYLTIIIAWLATGLLAGFVSLGTSYYKGIPEIDGVDE